MVSCRRGGKQRLRHLRGNVFDLVSPAMGGDPHPWSFGDGSYKPLGGHSRGSFLGLELGDLIRNRSCLLLILLGGRSGAGKKRAVEKGRTSFVKKPGLHSEMPHSYMDIKTLVPISNPAPELTLMLAPTSPNHHTPSDLYLVSLAFLILPLYQIVGGAQASTLQPFLIELFRYFDWIVQRSENVLRHHQTPVHVIEAWMRFLTMAPSQL